MSKPLPINRDDSFLGFECEKDVKSKDIEDLTARMKKRKSAWSRWTESVCRFLRQTAKGVGVGDKPALEDLEIPLKYRPRDFHSTCQATGFSPASLRRLYRGFKTECPTGLMTEEVFRQVFAKFFPNGASCSAYSHYVFSSMDQENTGVVSFEEFAQALSLLRRGSLKEKLVWTFQLYDLNGDGVLSRDEIEDVTIAIYSLMGDKETGTPPAKEVINTRVEMVAKKFCLSEDNRYGGISLDQFMAVCMRDTEIYQALMVMGDTR